MGGGSTHASFAALLSVISSAAYKAAHAGARSGAGSEISGAIVKAAARLEGRFDDLEEAVEEVREAGQAAAEAGQAAAEGTQAQVASVLAATHAVGKSVQAVRQRIEDSIAATAEVKALTVANATSLNALENAATERERQELMSKLTQLESASRGNALHGARHDQLNANLDHLGAMVSSLLHRAGEAPAAEAPLRATPTPAPCAAPPSAPRASRESTAAAASAKRPKTTHAFGSSYQMRGESSAMLKSFPAKRLPSLSLPTGQPLSPSGKGNRGL
jgi:hypothetical protein